MNKLRRIRAEKGLTMDEVVELVEERTGGKVSKRTISEMERGMRNAHTLTYAKLATALDVDIEELLEDENPKGSAPPSQSREAEEERRRARLSRVTFVGWTEVLKDLRGRLQAVLDHLPPLPDNKKDLARREAEIQELVDEFYSIQRDVNSSGDPHLMWPYVEAKDSRQHLPNDLYKAIADYQSVLKTLNLELIPRTETWRHRAEKTLDGLKAAESEAVPEEEPSEKTR